MTQFIDANVMIKAFTDNEYKYNCRKVLSNDFVTNALCLVEAQHSISIIKNDKIYASDCIKSLFKNQGIIVELNKNLLFETFKRISKYNLNIRDFDGLEIKRIEP